MKLLALILIGLQLLQTGCVVWHEGYPEVLDNPGGAQGTEVSFYYVVVSTSKFSDASYKDELDEENTRLMRHAIKKHFKLANEVRTDTSLPNDNYVRILVEGSQGDHPQFSVLGLPYGIGLLFALYIPGSDEIIYSTRFDLHNKGLVSTYGPYKHSQKTKLGILWIPFLWMNFLTSGKEDAFSATVQQFIIDAHLDGHL